MNNAVISVIRKEYRNMGSASLRLLPNAGIEVLMSY